MSEMGPTADSCSAEDRYSITSAEQRRREIDAERLDLREHRNAPGPQPGGLQSVVISGQSTRQPSRPNAEEQIGPYLWQL